MNINKKVARQYQLSINSYLPEYRACSEAFMLIKQKGIHVKEGYEKLKLILQENSSNQFALLKRGKILLSNHLFMRRNISKALDLIQKATRTHGEARYLKTCSFIEEHNKLPVPLVLSQNQVVLSGIAAYAAAKEKGLKAVPVIILENVMFYDQ